MRDKSKAWHLGSAGALISQEREYKALHAVKNMKVRRLLCNTVAAKSFYVCSLHVLLATYALLAVDAFVMNVSMGHPFIMLWMYVY